jgi:signal transduction histidine kinase/CheY-like chemotaxis protein
VDERENKTLLPSEEAQLRALLAAMEAANRGDFSHRLPVHGIHPLVDQLAEAFNTGVSLSAALTQELVRVAKEVGTEGKLGGQASVPGVSGAWKDLIDHVNALAASFTAHVRDFSRVATAVARGDLSEKVTLDVGGEALELKNTVNTMVDQLSAFAAEVSRVSKEVGVEGRRGGQSLLYGVSGVWKDLNDNMSVTEQLALASRHKSEFLANMSHELRTPLNSLLILSKVLSENKESRLSPKEVEYAKTIHASGSDLLSLVNELLDLSKVEAGKMRVEPSDVPLAEVKEFVERSFRHVADQKGLGFTVSLGTDLPQSLRTDPQRLQQVLKNLLSNAFKFTGSGRVDLHISRVDGQHMRFDSERLQRARGVIAFRVVDSGIGIPKDKQKLIFEAFQQADDTTSRRYGGTGLGLSISLAMTRLLGGELHVDSQPGQGSAFTLYLPEQYTRLGGEDGEVPGSGGSTPELARPSLPLTRRAGVTAEGHPLPPTQAVSGVSLAGRKVLIVDDDIRNIFALTSILEGLRAQVMFAENGKAGLEMLNAHPSLDVVLMDMMMPELDGYEAIRAIRRDPRFAALPVIAVTAQALTDDREKCLAAGASDYLTKPVDTERLIELLHRWLR